MSFVRYREQHYITDSDLTYITETDASEEASTPDEPDMPSVRGRTRNQDRQGTSLRSRDPGYPRTTEPSGIQRPRHRNCTSCPNCKVFTAANKRFQDAYQKWEKETAVCIPCSDAMDWQFEPTTVIETRERRMSEVLRPISAATGRRVSFLADAVAGRLPGQNYRTPFLEDQEEWRYVLQLPDTENELQKRGRDQSVSKEVKDR